MLRNFKFFSAIFFCFATCYTQGQALHLKIKSIDSSQLKVIDSLGYRLWHQDFNAVNDEVTLFLKKLERIGYIENKLYLLEKSSDSLYTALVTLNHRYKTIRLYDVSLKNIPSLKNLVTNTSTDFVEVDIQNLENTLNLINKELSSRGDPFAIVQLENLKRLDNHTISGVVKTEWESTRNVDSIVIKGYEKFPKGFLKHQLKLTSKTVFDLNKIKNKTLNFQNLNFVNQLKEPEVLFTQDSTILYLYLEKKLVNSFDGFLGFGTDEESNKLQFDGYLNLNLINNLNYGETLRLYYKSDENEQRTFDVTVKMPYLFKSPIGASANLNIFRRDSTFLNTEQSFKLDYQINLKNSISVGITGLNSTNLAGNTNVFIQDFKSNFYSGQYNHFTPQFYDLLFPINFYFDIVAGLGNRNDAAETISQTLFKINTYKIFNLNDRNSVFLRFDGAGLFSDNYFENELFRFGGINSIRGFEENTLLANLYGVLNTEYRYRLSNDLYVHTVFDAAYSENQITNINNKLYGFGFGFGLMTNAGLFRFNYSSAKTENQAFQLSDSKVHISLTSTF